MSNVKMYRYKRGTKYSVLVKIMDEENIVMDQVIYPNDTNEAVKARLVEDAEKEALKHWRFDRNKGR